MFDLIRRADALVKEDLIAEVLPNDRVLEAAAHDLTPALAVKILKEFDPMEAVESLRL
jgi:hypothetical protein